MCLRTVRSRSAILSYGRCLSFSWTDRGAGGKAAGGERATERQSDDGGRDEARGGRGGAEGGPVRELWPQRAQHGGGGRGTVQSEIAARETEALSLLFEAQHC